MPRLIRGSGYERLARTQGYLYVVTGVWPLVSMSSFEAVTGPKTDRWLVRTVSGLLVTIGTALLRVNSSAQSGWRRHLGIGAAATLAGIDVLYASRGRISRVYFIDAIAQVTMLYGWLRRR